MALEILSGYHAVVEAIEARRRCVHEIFVTREHIAEIRSLGGKNGVPVRAVDATTLRKLTNQEKPQGIAARVDPFLYSPFSATVENALRDPLGAFLVILDQVQDPQNFGALVRTAYCSGAHGLIVPKDNAAHVTASVCRAAAGATEYLPIVQVTNIVQMINHLKSQHVWIVGAAGEARTSLYDYHFDGHHALAIGTEGRGLRRLVRESCDTLLAIPMQGVIQSYNVSVAAAMLMGEMLRQRISPKRGKSP